MEEPTAPVLGRRRGPRWTTVAYGLHRPSNDADPCADLRAWQLVLPPSGRFTHLTGALLYGWWTPPLPGDLPVFSAQSRSDPRPQRPGLRVGRRGDAGPHRDLRGLRVDPPAEVLLSCARDLTLVDVVVLVDAALHLQAVTRAALEATAAGRRRGAPMLRRALTLADGRSESAWETLLRLLHVVCDVQVEPQLTLYDETGTFLARADLWVRGTNALHEYDGEDHLSRARQRKDLRRARTLGNQAWLRRGYTSREVLHQAVGILRDADLSLGREHRPERVRRWYAMLAGSLFTPSGTSRFRERIGLDAMGGRRHRDPA
jgi:hypothetical protein